MLLLDEPLANLDRELRREMEIEVRRFQQDLGIPFVYVTHNQEEALTLSDRIAVMHEGRIEQVGAQARDLSPSGDPVRRRVRRRAEPPARAHRRAERRPCPTGWDGIDLISRRIEEAPVGDVVDLFLKPERIRIMAAARAGGDGYNRLEGVLRDVIFKGPTWTVWWRSEPAQELTVSAPPETPGLVRGGRGRDRLDARRPPRLPGRRA